MNSHATDWDSRYTAEMITTKKSCTIKMLKDAQLCLINSVITHRFGYLRAVIEYIFPFAIEMATLKVLFLLLLQWSLSDAGAFFELELESFEPKFKGETKFVNMDKMRVKKVNKTHHLIIGELTYNVDADNSYDIEHFMYQKAGNDYKLMPFKLKKQPFCEVYASENLFLPGLIATSDLPAQDIVR